MAKSRRKLLLLLAVPVLLCIIASLITVMVMRSQFGRGAYPDPSYSAYYWYEPDYCNAYPRENVQFQSGENTLQGYLYGLENPEPKALLVFAHGIGAGHESYINQLIWMVDHNYLVFAYDATGSCTSEGSGTVGLVQSALDLHCALTYAEGDERLNTLPVVLLGHSWGGYAVSAVQNFDHEITAACSISGYAYPLEMLNLGAEQVMGKPLGTLFRPFAWGYHQLTFGEYAGLNAVDGINHSGIPTLVIHGEKDTFVDYQRVSILSKQEEITNPNVQFLTLTGEFANHDDFFNSDASNAYIQQWNEEMDARYGKQKLSDAERKAIYAAADKTVVNDYNTDLLETIDAFYTEALTETESSAAE